MDVPRTRQVAITHEEPVYDIKYEFEVDRWVTSRWVTTEGTSKENLRWPELLKLSRSNTRSQIGNERKGDERRENYTVTVTDSDGESYRRSVDFKTWDTLNIGHTVVATFNERTGNLVSIDWNKITEPIG